MQKTDVAFTEYLKETYTMMAGDGLLLVTQAPGGKPNIMTIGWGAVGVIWGKPIFTILVRPSRYSYELLAQSPDFTVNVPTPELRGATVVCGSLSGREIDKFADLNLTPLPAIEVSAPLVAQCAIHYECRVVHLNNVIPNELAGHIVSGFYAKGDFHRVYFGEILRTCVDVEKIEQLHPAAQ